MSKLKTVFLSVWHLFAQNTMTSKIVEVLAFEVLTACSPSTRGGAHEVEAKALCRQQEPLHGKNSRE